MSPIQQLDAVLNVIADDSCPPSATSLQIDEILKRKGINIKNIDLILMLEKLKDDKYIYRDKSKGHLISFEGKIFNESGGYLGVIERNNKEKETISKLDERSMSQQSNIVALTFWVALGSISLCVIEILTRWNDMVSFFCHCN